MLKSTGTGEKVSRAFGRAFSKLPLSPMFYTYLSVGFALLATLIIFLRGTYLPGFVFFLFAFLMDLVDGAVARAKNKVSTFGAFADGVADRVVETLFLFSLGGMLLREGMGNEVLFLIMGLMAAGTYMTSFLKAYADHRSAITKEEVEEMHGILERGERSIMLVLAMAFVILKRADLAFYLLVLTFILACITVLQRYIYVWRRARKNLKAPRDGECSAPLKQVIVVRKDLKMGKGKLAAQVAHASLSAFLISDEKKREEWLASGQKKIVLRAEDEGELINLYKKARNTGLKPVLIRDAGLTQVEEGTITALAVGPDAEEKLNKIFKSLKLL